MSKKALYSNDETQPYVWEFPERNLWLAVIERALKDYCFFFEKLQHYANCNNRRDISRWQLNPKSKSHFNAIADFDRLRWFLFEPQPITFNLTYLSHALYDTDGFANNVRKAANAYFKRHLDQTREQQLFPHVIKYIVTNTNVDEAQPAPEECRLRFKRYRIDSDF